MEVRPIKPSQTYPLRHKVLWPHIDSMEACTIDIDDRPDGIHFGTFLDDKIISIASFFELRSDKIRYQKQYRLRAMATDDAYRGIGAGRILIQTAIAHLAEKNVDVLWCNAREVALDFYSKLGFSVIDEWYNIPNIGPHKFMYFPIQSEQET